MKFTIDANDLKTYLERASLKKRLSDELLIIAENGQVVFYNGDEVGTCILKIELTLSENALETEGRLSISLSKLLSFIRKFSGDVVLSRTDGGLSLTNGNRTANIPTFTISEMQTRILSLNSVLDEMSYVREFKDDFTLPSWNNSWSFEFAGNVLNARLQEAITTCDVVKSGIYTFNATNQELKISSGAINQGGSYTESISCAFFSGSEEATVSFEYPIHEAFAKDSVLTLYLKDDSPIVISSYDSVIMKAPRIEG